MIAIIIATYNAEKYIEKTLVSLTNQINNNFELIIIDGKSTDQTISIINKYKYIVTTLISEKDSGIYDAWNKGISIANKKWILFLGAGDTLYPGTLDFYNKVLESIDNNIEYVSAKINLVDYNEKKIGTIGKKLIWEEFSKNMTVAHVGSLHKKALFEDIGYFNNNKYNICADYELLLRKKENLHTLFLDLIIGEMLSGGISFSNKALIQKAKIQINHKLFPIYHIIFNYCFQFFLLKTHNLRKKF
jgi:glycosyltransferase involved in cell wall biosynthesis